jgi:hypothetical protein
MIIKRQHDEGLVYKDSAVETGVAPTFAVDETRNPQERTGPYVSG